MPIRRPRAGPCSCTHQTGKRKGNYGAGVLVSIFQEQNPTPSGKNISRDLFTAYQDLRCMHMMISVAYISSISPSQNASRPSAPSKVQTIIKVAGPSLQNMHPSLVLAGLPALLVRKRSCPPRE